MNIEELMNDESFKEAVVNAESVDAVADILMEHGIELSTEELRSEFEEMSASELDESALENISGGGWLSSLCHRINAIRYKAGGGGFNRGGGGSGSGGGGRAGSR